MIKITYPGVNNFSTFGYDGKSHTNNIIETNSGSVTSTKQFVWSGDVCCEERDGTGTLTKKFYRGAGQINASTKYFYSLDHLGSITLLTDPSGNALASYAYGPFGVASLLQGTNIADFQYTGLYEHVRSGLNLAITRPLATTLGRWVCRDIIEEAGGTNLFGYVRNNPIVFTDTLGLVCVSCLSAVPRRWPLPWPPSNGIGRPGEAEFFNCKFGNSVVNCRTCCGNKFDDLHNDDSGYCEKMFGPNGSCPDPQKYKCCVAWATRYLEYCIRRCNGSWGWNDPTPPPDDPDCQGLW